MRNEGSFIWVEIVGHLEFESSSLEKYTEMRAQLRRNAVSRGIAQVVTPVPWPKVKSIIGSERDVTVEQNAFDAASREHEGRMVALAAMAAGEKAMSYACHGRCTLHMQRCGRL